MNLKRFFSREAFIILSLTTIILSLNAATWIVRLSNTPVGHDFIPIHNSLDDYPFYVSIIRQGMDGGRVVMDRFAVELHRGSALHFLYLFIGWTAALFGIQSASVAYHLSRYILGFVWCLTIYWLINTLIREKWTRIAAFFFAVFSASFPKFILVNNQVSIAWFMTWWSELDPIIRSAFIPHFLVGHITMTVAIISLIRYDETRGKSWVWRGGLSGFIAAFVHPPSALLLLFLAPVYLLFEKKREWVMAIVVMITTTVGLLLVNQMTGSFPWNLAREFEQISFAISLREYAFALGPVILLALLGVVSRRRQRNTLLLMSWILFSILMIPISQALLSSPSVFIRTHALSNIRFLQLALWVPLGILGAYGLVFIWNRWGKFVGYALLTACVAVTFLGYPASMNGEINRMFFSANYTYPAKGYIEAIMAMKGITRPDQTILSLSLGGLTSPMYINRSTYVGQRVYTPYYDNKLKEAWLFFHGGMSVCDAYTLVKNNRVGAVLYSFDEKNSGDAVRFYPFLQPWNTYGGTEIFTVVDLSPVGCNK